MYYTLPVVVVKKVLSYEVAAISSGILGNNLYLKVFGFSRMNACGLEVCAIAEMLNSNSLIRTVQVVTARELDSFGYC
jgi:hypothetical protein